MTCRSADSTKTRLVSRSDADEQIVDVVQLKGQNLAFAVFSDLAHRMDFFFLLSPSQIVLGEKMKNLCRRDSKQCTTVFTT